MIDKKTSEIDELLSGIKPDQLGEFYGNNSKYMANGEKAFYYYMKDVIESKNILLKDVYNRANVTESYGEKIIRMEKHTKSRDLIITLCLAGHFTLEETNRALKLYGMSQLYSKDKRDSAIIVAIINRIYLLPRVNEILKKQNLPELK